MTTILGIETSCDETAAAVVIDGTDVRSNVVASQAALHRKYGGVVPEIASRAHIECFDAVVAEALATAEITPDGLDAIAVTHRPGLVGSLLIGLTAAKTLSWAWENHWSRWIMCWPMRPARPSRWTIRRGPRSG
jgi:N6-L-threonylcarbamoyladenine synthase